MEGRPFLLCVMSKLDQFSANRLNGETVPEDLRLLLEHADEFESRTGIRIAPEEQWAPWSDTSYLTAKDLQDPGIVANIKAIDEVCSMIAFVAEHEDHEFIGYWRGPAGRSIADSPLVWLDNEGQFNLCSEATFAQVILGTYESDELTEWMQSIGIQASASPADDRVEESDPGDMHWQLQEKYLGGA